MKRLALISDKHYYRSRSKGELLVTLTLEQIMTNGLWPKVISVCTFKNSDSRITSKSQLTELEQACSEHDCSNIESFTNLVQFDERTFKTPVSYVFCLVPYYVDIEEDLTELEVKAALIQHDLLVGSRCGTVTAVDWLLDFFKSSHAVGTLEIEYIDAVFGNALIAASKPRRYLNKGDMIAVVNGHRQIEEFPLETDQ